MDEHIRNSMKDMDPLTVLKLIGLSHIMNQIGGNEDRGISCAGYVALAYEKFNLFNPETIRERHLAILSVMEDTAIKRGKVFPSAAATILRNAVEHVEDRNKYLDCLRNAGAAIEEFFPEDLMEMKRAMNVKLGLAPADTNNNA